jgi:hypothetical protein
MKIMSIVFLLFLSLTSFAEEGAECLTHGQCQEGLPTVINACFKIKTGVNNEGKVTCKIACRSIAATFFCHRRFAGRLFGDCRMEKIETPIMDPSDTRACADAVTPRVLDL